MIEKMLGCINCVMQLIPSAVNIHRRVPDAEGNAARHGTLPPSLKSLLVGLATVLAGITMAVGPAYAAGQNEGHHAIVRYPDNSARSHPLPELPQLPDVVYDVRKLERKMLPNRLGSPDNPQADAVLQDAGGGLAAVTTGANFEGLGNTSGVLPPDTVGDIGPNHYVQMTNLSFAIYDRSGMLLYGPVLNNTLWGPLGNVCATSNDGDPVVLYDEAVDRWLMSQFALPNYPNGPFYQCLAVSQTGDPTGGWYLYAYLISQNKLNDYPKFGVWPDAYYMSVNQFRCNAAGSCSWRGQGVVAFERDKMLVGDPGALAVYFDNPDPDLGGMLPADWDGTAPPPADAPNPFVQVDDDAWGYPNDRLWIWNFHVDWSNPSASTFMADRSLPTASFDSNLCGYDRNCIPQPSGTPVDALSDRLMFRLQYRNFGTHQVLLANHTVDVGGADQAGVRWYELNDTGGGWEIYQQGTYAPDGDHRWMGSVAMNGVGDIALGYSASSGTTYPSIRFTGRLAGDPLGLMTQGEGTIINGGGSQSHSTGRWGDYSMMSVDPTDDCTFWYTQEYYPSNSSAGWHTRIGSFTLSDCGTPDSDGDGILDDVDNCPTVANANQADGDGDGAGDACDLCPSDPGKTDPGLCGCGVADTDGDTDGTPDCNDLCSADPTKVDPGICGCGTPDTDSDGDGTPDCNDGCAADPAKIDPGVCGCGVADTDGDGDGLHDCIDNCTEAANTDQRDTNQDGYGNRCDPDVDNNGLVGLSDFNVLRLQFGKQNGDTDFDPDVDFDGNGVVGLSDFNILRSLFGGPPGPSGLDCAGTIPCP